ncbi:hypothetical protein A2715_05465 [Candidatus Woesebacteria bacterium RIFCSPHIGHO2_01_FULL_39_32]|uniref:Uncharacterized protein n=1 Tax=Candidatus Woesebacteria bacterium RIFCSPLOWO2_01_FULL_39_25 TaxID=1802521 RepID=A0A1F8BMW1_9BACT|nr:MAG: hypothetical protein A2715_05465 [Candidatus Woesebacteria bacterium RIFCSPHIGHO2_01_FULL_39_32]OGM38571.1 MAG: hypothetical protein A3F01_04420 [Candidatus Woesebacteria bacterium RIFCSPHIGHO2_12_FULL_38_11]OGM64999.1 MAG: hypothetical protein A2893_05075 [Candidatus Woesebacteria bacterium RIFCSPLOWO2_01_FULL_39_25]
MDPENPATEEQRLADFFEQVKRADGTLIPLTGQLTRFGEEILVSARYGSVDSLAKADHLLLVDLFARSADQMLPIGHYDWEVTGNRALGNKNRHGGHLPNTSNAHELADRAWTEEGLKVYDKSLVSYAMEKGGFPYMDQLRETGIVTDEKQWGEPTYQKQGLGSFMIAVSAIVLESKGVETANLGSLTPAAEGVWKKFGQSGGVPVQIGVLIQNNKIDEVLEEFV